MTGECGGRGRLTLTDIRTNTILPPWTNIPRPNRPTSPSSFPATLYYQAIHELCAGLPPPVTGPPEDRARRDNAAIAVACHRA